MKILIVDFDIIGKAGGGQTVYSKLIENIHEHQFFFFTQKETPASDHIKNVFGVFHKNHYRPDVRNIPEELHALYYNYVECCQLAASIKSTLGDIEFDIVDVPDYTTRGLFIRQALLQHGIRANRLALSLHGTISNAIEGDWARHSDLNGVRNQTTNFERIQFETADVRYAISESYKNYWESVADYPIKLVSPLHIVGEMSRHSAVAAPEPTQSAAKPDLVFVGRREKIKGPDLFLDLAWAAGPKNFNSVRVIGNESVGFTGIPSIHSLQEIARHRGLDVSYSDALPPAELDALFRSRTIIVLPSRIDTLNLVALEALRTACPVFISNRAGASQWIQSHYPELSHLVIGLSCSRISSTVIRDAAVNYDAFRKNIFSVISSKLVSANVKDLRSLYWADSKFDIKRRCDFDKLADYFRLTGAPIRKLAISADSHDDPVHANNGDEATLTPPKDPNADMLRVTANLRPFFIKTINSYPRNYSELRQWIPQYSEAIGAHRHGRVQIMRKLQQLEQMRSQDLTSALYSLRLLRWLGPGTDSEVSYVSAVFRDYGFENEAAVVDAMYGSGDLSFERSSEFIRERYEQLRSVELDALQFVDDRRGAGDKKVAVICSLYNAADKLPTLIENVAAQSLAQTDDIEVVLIDSGSPGDEYQAFCQLADRFKLSMVYARSVLRETIQCAWNRGIGLSSAAYLCFYGADEGMHPECLQVLAASLDAYPEVDWVMSDSIVTDVSSDGVYAGDVTKYTRAGFDKDMVYLDTCYLSWVGGLYRRSIHDRFGYYDPSFRAAGDTEFKSRVLNKINVLHIPGSFGVFNNYPEERTTAHPRAEIEDQRAWYLHRTAAGMANLFASRSSENAVNLFKNCLSYRKTYCVHISTDFDLAAAIVEFLETRGDCPEFVKNGRLFTNRAINLLREIERLNILSPLHVTSGLLSSHFSAFSALEEEAQRMFQLERRPEFRIFNDNRFEQHWWSWSTI